MCVSLLSASVYVYHVCVWCLLRLVEDVQFPGTGDTDVVSHHMGAGSLLQEQVLLFLCPASNIALLLKQ